MRIYNLIIFIIFFLHSNNGYRMLKFYSKNVNSLSNTFRVRVSKGEAKDSSTANIPVLEPIFSQSYDPLNPPTQSTGYINK